ncbi:hypothetical protein [Dactylosporangium darangshiense]|uniref:Secreted protein n=1 Tax=Dactylosporangium darangshiense TaxID=579108 RepID=A0ABP8D0L8_9ACTN
MKFRMLPVAATAMLALTACTGGGGGGDQAAPSATPNAAPKALLDAAQCMRDNGFPEWPDPMRYSDGHWGWPDSAPQVQQPPAACSTLMRQGKDAQAGSRRAVSPEEMVKLRKWAECVRAHGIPDWPDPDAAGQFDPPTRLKPLDGNEDLQRASEACVALEPADGIAMKADPGVTKPAAG